MPTNGHLSKCRSVFEIGAPMLVLFGPWAAVYLVIWHDWNFDESLYKHCMVGSVREQAIEVKRGDLGKKFRPAISIFLATS